MEATIRHASVANLLRDLVSEAKKERHEDAELAMEIASQYAWSLFFDISRSMGRTPLTSSMEGRLGTPTGPQYFATIEVVRDFLNGLGWLGTPYETQ
jgi:hypothetical protein